MDQDTSDIGRAWEDALDKYCKDTGTNIKYLPQMKWSVEAIMSEQQRQVELFSQYRHNKGLTDKFRSVISKNSAIIQSVASNVANAASSAFPPSAAILTAFTYVMQASKNVSDDYDQVAAFFDIMGSLMERLSLLETKLPSAKNYRTILMRVFTSLMGLCGTATYYVTQGRFKHWLKALYKGADDDLTTDYSKLQSNIQRLESATMFATLATVVETKSDVKDLTAISMQSLKVGTQNLAVSTQTLSATMETQSMVGGLSVKAGETFTAIQRLERRMIRNEESKKENEKEKEGLRKPKDAGAKRNAALNLVKTMFATRAEPAIQLKEIHAAFVPGTFGWVFEEDGYKAFMDGSGDPRILWISGPPGIGKSCVAHSIIGKLIESTSSDRNSRAAVAYYFFREEHEELRSAENMLKAAVIQTAIGDGKYRDEILAEIKAKGEVEGGVDELWRRCFAERYPKDAEQKLYLVLDGLDEADEKDRKQVLKIMEDIKRDELSIQVVFTSRPTEEIQLATSIVDITREKISKRGGDLWKVIMKRCKTLSKLKRLPKPAWRKIGIKLRLKADSVLYVEHMLRRLNALGREPLIFKELDKLPENLPKLYELLLADCQKDRTREQLTALKKLFAWLAYSKRPLTLGEATSLIKIIPGTKSFSLEEEIDGRSARILDLATDVGEEESSSEESDSEIVEKQIEEEDASSLDNSITSPLKFQERSMRQYFRAMEVDDNGLRSSPSAGHFTIFEMAARILNTPETESTDDKGEDKLWQLRNYAATFWMEHFLDVDLENTSADGVQSVISSLHTIMNPEGEALKNIELCVNNFDNVSLFGGPADHLRDQFFDHFNVWLNRARNLDVSSFSPEVLNWISSCSSQEETIVHLAKGHVLNWFKAHRSYEARGSFEFARTTLCMTKSGPPLSKDTDTDQEHAEGDILKVSIAFPEIPKTSQALRAIGMVFYSFDNYSAALAQMDQSLEIATAITDRFDALFWIGDIQLNLSEKANEEDQKDHVLKAYDAINASIALYESSDEVKKFAETVDMKIVVQVNLTNRAICEVKLGEIDKAIASMDEAYRVMGSDDRALPGEFVDDITASLEKAGDFEKLISVVGHFHKFDLLVWLGFPSANGHDRFQHAAWECKKQDFMIKKYEDMIVESDKYNAGAHARSQLATIYHYVVVPNLKESKRLLFEIMDGKKGVPFDDADENFIFDTRLQLADVLLEQFRAATDPMSKIALQGEMKTLALQDKVALRHDFNPYESQTTISLALMTGKMGPTNEFQSLMDNTFREAINSLTDNEAWNDSGGFRILAKVLAFVPEMHRDAQIASSLQFSAVNEKLFKEADESRDGQPSDTNIKEPLAKGNDTESAVEEKEIIIHEITEVKIQPQEASPNVQEIQLPTTTTEEVTADITEDLNPNSNVLCNGCDRSFNNWRDGAVYGCIECTDCDLCEDCFKKIDRCNKGEPWTEWKRYCGENHKYIRGPIAGWKGVKDGVIRIERVGDGEQGGGLVEEVEFGVWIDGLQNRWKEAWTGFWKREELVVDIF